jgi:thymidylate synthase ThyX
MYDAYVVKDSIADGKRLTTLAATMPRIILAEQNTHRDFSRNTASSRAIPVKTRCDMIEKFPFVPDVFGKNQKGMQASENLDPEANTLAEQIWREALADALRHSRRLADVGVHKQYANRLTEPFAWVTQLVTATEWNNYMNLRVHKDAQPEIMKVASLMKRAMAESTPVELKVGEFHLPFVDTPVDAIVSPWVQDNFKGSGEAELRQFYNRTAVLASQARCAAVSYEKHNVQKSIGEETGRATSLRISGHMSPFEHQARVANDDEILEYAMFRWSKEEQKFVPKKIGNFAVPWLQDRKTIPGEDVFGTHVE